MSCVVATSAVRELHVSKRQVPPCYFKVLSMNVNGVLLMQKNRNAEAISCFHEGLSILLLELSSSPTSCRSCGHLGCCKRHHHDGMGTDFGATLRPVESVELPKDNHLSAHDDIFKIFNRALHMSNDIGDVMDNPRFCCHLLSTVMTYNVGLAHHLEGLNRSNSVMLARGLEFYSMAYTALTSEGTCLSGKDQYFRLALLALANNIGHVHAYFRCLDETGICSDELSLRLTATMGEIGVATVVDTEYHVFYMNACFFRDAELSSAPAA